MRGNKRREMDKYIRWTVCKWDAKYDLNQNAKNYDIWMNQFIVSEIDKQQRNTVEFEIKRIRDPKWKMREKKRAK